MFKDTVFSPLSAQTQKEIERELQGGEEGREGGREAERCFADRITLSPPCQISDTVLNISAAALSSHSVVKLVNITLTKNNNQ